MTWKRRQRRPPAATVDSLRQYESWGFAITAFAATHDPPHPSHKMVRYDPEAEIIPEGFTNPNKPAFRKLNMSKTRENSRRNLNITAATIASGLNTLGEIDEATERGIRQRVSKLNKSGWKKWSIDDEIERGRSPFWWTSEELRLMKIDNLVEMCHENSNGGWEKAPEEHEMVQCGTCDRPIHPVHLVEKDPSVDYGTRPENRRKLEAENKQKEIELQRIAALPPASSLLHTFLSFITGFDFSEVHSTDEGEEKDHDEPEEEEDNEPQKQKTTRWNALKLVPISLAPSPTKMMMSKKTDSYRSSFSKVPHKANSGKEVVEYPKQHIGGRKRSMSWTSPSNSNISPTLDSSSSSDAQNMALPSLALQNHRQNLSSRYSDAVRSLSRDDSEVILKQHEQQPPPLPSTFTRMGSLDKVPTVEVNEDTPLVPVDSSSSSVGSKF